MIGSALMLGRTALGAFKAAGALRNTQLGNVSNPLGLPAGKTSGKTGGFWANARAKAQEALKGVSLRGSASYTSGTGLNTSGSVALPQTAGNSKMLMYAGGALLLLMLLKK